MTEVERNNGKYCIIKWFVPNRILVLLLTITFSLISLGNLENESWKVFAAIAFSISPLFIIFELFYVTSCCLFAHPEEEILEEIDTEV
ncbi:MAG: hypothetical protein KC414_14060 [Romboutsia sp.]|nr:hypothetical protein [Romboutsia sp.]